jgi:hypothetical protein
MVEWKMIPPDGCLLPYITKFVTWGIIGRNLEANRAKITQNLHKICQNKAGAAQGAAWSGRTGDCAARLRESVRAGVAAPSPAKAL